MLQQQLAGLGQHHAPAVAAQKGLAQLHFQLPHLPAQQGLGHAQGHGGAGEAAQLGHAHKGFDLTQVHLGIWK